MRAIGGLSAGESCASLPDWNSRKWSVLYLRAQGIGDVILATGALRAIARSHPTIALDVLTTRAAAPVLDHNPYVRRVHATDSGSADAVALVNELRRSRYDVIVDGKITRGASFIRSPVLSMLARAPYRIGVGGGNHHLVFNICVPRYDRTTTHMVDGSAALTAPFGVDMVATDFHPEIFLQPEERARADRLWNSAAATHSSGGERWLVNLSAGAPIRRWADEHWISLVDHLRARHPCATVGVMAAGSEQSSAQRVAQATGATALNTPRLRDALALVGTSERVITADTSVTHAATAFRVPTVLLLQRGLEQWGSYHTPCEVAYWAGSSIASLDVETAYDAVDRLLASRPVASLLEVVR
ncbi:MAG: glycosyltransferase family 9 protein [Gemmatimonadota bacterium]